VAAPNYPPPQPGSQIPYPQPYASWYPVYDPKDLYYAGQDDKPAFIYEARRDNPAAITAFSFAICSLGLLLISGGISFLASLPTGILGIVIGRRSLKATETDDTAVHRNYARAGFVIGIVSTVLASLSAALFILVAAFPDAFDVEEESRIPVVIAFRLASGLLGL
jgi:hypothetical protein